MKKFNLQAVIITVIFLSLLILFGIFLVPYCSEGWRYTYAMGRAGLYIRTFVSILLLVIPLLVLAVYKRKRAWSYKSPASISGILAAVFLVAGMIYVLDVIPTTADLFSKPVTEELYVDLRYSRNTGRSAKGGSYMMRPYDADGKPARTWWSAGRLSWNTSLRFSMFETLLDDEGNVIFDPPVHGRWLRPKSGSYVLFHGTVTYYPHSGTRVSISNFTQLTEEEFPDIRNADVSVDM